MTSGLKIEGTQLFDEYILVAPGSDYGRAMWSDIELLPNGTILDSALKKTNKIVSAIHHAHFSYAINRRLQLPLQHIWRRLYSLESVKWNDEKKYCVILSDNSACRIDKKYMMDLSRKPNITLVLVMVNTMARRDNLITRRLPAFSLVLSFDKNDSDQYGFAYHPTNYSKMQLQQKRSTSIDAFYVGVSKGRADIIGEVYQRLVNGGCQAEFFISGIEKSVKKISGIYYNKWLTYGQVLARISDANCIVEIMDGKQQGVTLRTMEAICYNKKLLTNNKAMLQSKYYSSGNIMVFDKVEDIDPNFAKNKDIVDYGYDGEFSPVHLLEHINSIFVGVTK